METVLVVAQVHVQVHVQVNVVVVVQETVVVNVNQAVMEFKFYNIFIFYKK